MLIFYRMRNVLIIRCLSSCGGGYFDRCAEYQKFIRYFARITPWMPLRNYRSTFSDGIFGYRYYLFLSA